MTESSGFFNAELVNDTYDREYLAEHFAKYFSLFIANGVFPNPSDGLQVFENVDPDMNVLMHPGYAWIDGYWYKLDGNLLLAIDPADGVLNRVDSIVVRWDLEQRRIYSQVVKGTPASEPAAPEVLRSADYSDLCVAHIRVDAGTTKITQSMITDTRMDNSLCGIVTGVVQSIDTTTLFEQYQAALKEFQDSRMTEFDEWQAQEKDDFDVWFQTIKDTLDGDTAGNLLNLIEQEKQERKAADEEMQKGITEVKGSVTTLQESVTGLSEAVSNLQAGKLNATAERSGTTVAITAPEGAETVTFVAPANWTAGDRYTVNGTTVTLTDLNGEAIQDGWKQGAPVQFFVQGDKAFFKTGGSAGINETLPAQVTNFKAVQVSGAKSATVSWTNPSSYFNGILITKKVGSAPTGVKDGVQIYNGTGTSFTDSELEYGTTYYYRAFPYNSKGQYQTQYLVTNVTPVQSIRLNSLSEGALIRLDENNSTTPFFLAKRNYESALNGSGRCLMVRRYGTDAIPWNATNINMYDNSNLDTWMNGTYKNRLGSNIRSMILSTKIRYTPGSGNMEVGTISKSIFALSMTELGFSTSGHNVEGSKLPIADTLKSAADAKGYSWTRSPYTENSRESWGNYGGAAVNNLTATDYLARPCFCINGSTLLNPVPNSDGTYSLLK